MEKKEKRSVKSIDNIAISANTETAETVYKLGEAYRAFQREQTKIAMTENPGVPEENFPAGVFEPELLLIRRTEDEKPELMTIKWASKVQCDSDDVNGLLDFLVEQGRNCHINTGVHGDMKSGKF